jgi:tight adherence protein C
MIDLTMVMAFGGVTSFILLLWYLFGDSPSRVEKRLASVSGQQSSMKGTLQRSTLPRIGAMVMPENMTRREMLNRRVIQAGLYHKHSLGLVLGIKLLLMVCPIGIGIGLSGLGFLTLNEAVGFGAFIGLAGTLIPVIGLNYLKSKRQKKIRRSLPDALDVIVICLEGGLSLPASFDRVACELRTAHPMLADEMAILKREIQLGNTTGEALKKFANRFDIEELRSMASVVTQAEKYGASVTKALRVHADTLRLKRHQNAEAMAQKAPVKLVFPTVLFIFPALYIVMMAPAFMTVFDALGDF